MTAAERAFKMLDLEEWPFSTPLLPLCHSTVREYRHRTPSAWKSPPKRRNFRMNCVEVPFEQLMHGQLKRCRALEDIEGDDTCSKPRKKRRLRHSLSTSRLSEPYAIPTTYIPSRRALREGIWARQRVVGRNLLRKAAALNSFSKKRTDNQLATKPPRVHDNSTVTR